MDARSLRGRLWQRRRGSDSLLPRLDAARLRHGARRFLRTAASGAAPAASSDAPPSRPRTATQSLRPRPRGVASRAPRAGPSGPRIRYVTRRVDYAGLSGASAFRGPGRAGSRWRQCGGPRVAGSGDGRWLVEPCKHLFSRSGHTCSGCSGPRGAETARERRERREARGATRGATSTASQLTCDSDMAVTVTGVKPRTGATSTASRTQLSSLQSFKSRQPGSKATIRSTVGNKGVRLSA